MALDILTVEQFLSANKTHNDDKNGAIQTLLAAINDWPTPLSTFEDYEFQVSKFIGGPVTKGRVQNSLKEIAYSRDAWQAESLFQLVAVFNAFDEVIDLNGIIKVISSIMERQHNK